MFPSKSGRKRKSINRDDKKARNNERKYRHNKSDNIKRAKIERLRKLINDEKINLQNLLDDDIVLNEFLRFKN